MQKHDVDILVVGLGPAGSSAASAASAAGKNVLAIDRKAKAGYPVQCAEFVPQMMGVEVKGLSNVIEQPIKSMDTFVEAQDPNSTEPDSAEKFIMENFPGHMINRGEFDRELVEKAQANGADCRFVVGISNIDDDGLVHLTNGDVVKAKVIIGADGPRSKTGQAIGQVNTELLETRQITVNLLKPHFSTDIFLSNEIPGGYAWLFPKGKVANIGLGLIPQEKSSLKPVLEKLHGFLVKQGRVGAEVIRHTGGAIPVGGMLGTSSFKGAVLVLLAGDAAGLTNPITGAGINAAVMSGQLAGEAATNWLAGDGDAVEEYEEELEALFARSLKHAVKRRGEILANWNDKGILSASELQKGWIAFPEYWQA
ncbi:MAG: NAD(P)/FAD-dependent oxidoreductase [Sphingomonadales bacterium]|nr:NAD(P)/FAD-dependent oxidoreductase [Sphingomonadales bacterium]